MNATTDDLLSDDFPSPETFSLWLVSFFTFFSLITLCLNFASFNIQDDGHREEVDEDGTSSSGSINGEVCGRNRLPNSSNAPYLDFFGMVWAIQGIAVSARLKNVQLYSFFFAPFDVFMLHGLPSPSALTFVVAGEQSAADEKDVASHLNAVILAIALVSVVHAAVIIAVPHFDSLKATDPELHAALALAVGLAAAASTVLVGPSRRDFGLVWQLLSIFYLLALAALVAFLSRLSWRFKADFSWMPLRNIPRIPLCSNLRGDVLSIEDIKNSARGMSLTESEAVQLYFQAEISENGSVSNSAFMAVLGNHKTSFMRSRFHEKIYAFLLRSRRQVGRYWECELWDTQTSPSYLERQRYCARFAPGHSSYFALTVTRNALACFVLDGLPTSVSVGLLVTIESITLASYIITPAFTLLAQSRCEIIGAGARVVVYFLSLLVEQSQVSERSAGRYMIQAQLFALAHLFGTHVVQLVLSASMVYSAASGKRLAPPRSNCRSAGRTAVVTLGNNDAKNEKDEKRRAERQAQAERRARELQIEALAAKARADARNWKQREEKGRREAMTRKRQDAHAREDEGEERRVDSDGVGYTRREFLEFYGGLEEFERAPKLRQQATRMHGKSSAPSRRSRSPSLVSLLARSQSTFGSDENGAGGRPQQHKRRSSVTQGGKAAFARDERALSTGSVALC
jgi:hypothetical protein